MPEEYVFISDLHIGGDEQLKILDFENEFIAFLKMLGERRVQSSSSSVTRSGGAAAPHLSEIPNGVQSSRE